MLKTSQGALRRTPAREHDGVLGPTNLRSVWFVGAGFTTAVGYPLGHGLVGDLVDYLRGQNRGFSAFAGRRRINNSVAKKHHWDERQRILTDIFRFARRYLALSQNTVRSVDVAEFFSIAQALAEQPGLLGTHPRGLSTGGQLAGDFAHLYADLAAVTRSFFIDICSRANRWPSDFRSILGNIQPQRDAIVNFNWDEEVDCFLSTKRGAQRDVAYTAASWRPTKFLVLKPHGSIGWYDLAQGVDNADKYLIAGEDDDRMERSDKQLMSYFHFDLPKDVESGREFTLRCPPVITAPTFGKRFPYREQRLIWSDVIDICRRAQEFVFLGYSVPPDDFLTRAAIRCALAGRRRSIRCLIVTRLAGTDPDGRREIEKFRGVFGRRFGKHNLYPWTFGKSADGKRLFLRIISALAQAHV